MNTATIDIPDQSTALDIDAILRRAAAEKLGLSGFRTLLLLRDQSSAPLSVIAAHCGQTSSAVTSLADRLAKLGFVRREHSLTDRRSIRLVITFEGRNAVARILPPVTA